MKNECHTNIESNDSNIINYQSLLKTIGCLIENARSKVAIEVNSILLDTYWETGHYIIDFEQNGNARAEYGKGLLKQLSKDLTNAYGAGFNHFNLIYMRKLYLAFPKSRTLSYKLSWSHYTEILKCDDQLERDFYLKQCEEEKWNVRDLKRQMKSMLFHRIALSKPIEGEVYHCDLVFYHAILKCHVLIDLKRGAIKHEDIGQMNFYLNYFRHEVCQSDDNPPVGIVLGSAKDDLVMQYALEGISNQLFAAKYQLYLPKREILQSRLDAILNEADIEREKESLKNQ